MDSPYFKHYGKSGEQVGNFIYFEAHDSPYGVDVEIQVNYELRNNRHFHAWYLMITLYKPGTKASSGQVGEYFFTCATKLMPLFIDSVNEICNLVGVNIFGYSYHGRPPHHTHAYVLVHDIACGAVRDAIKEQNLSDAAVKYLLTQIPTTENVI